MRYRLRTLLIVSAIAPAILAGIIVILFAVFRFEPPERPPPPFVPATEDDRVILGIANQFIANKGVIDYSIPVKIEPWPNRDGCFIVEYWTPRREFRLLGSRAVIVNPTSQSANSHNATNGASPMFRFTIRDVLWLTVVVALGVVWQRDMSALRRERVAYQADRAAWQAEKTALLKEHRIDMARERKTAMMRALESVGKNPFSGPPPIEVRPPESSHHEFGRD